jgi:hypothetical protein
MADLVVHSLLVQSFRLLLYYIYIYIYIIFKKGTARVVIRLASLLALLRILLQASRSVKVGGGGARMRETFGIRKVSAIETSTEISLPAAEQIVQTW